MADIQTEIEKISSAVYGEEVRGAMANSLTKINAAQESISKNVGIELEQKANKTDVDTALAGKVDNAVGLKYATTNNIDDCTDDKTLYRVYINDSCVSHGYHNLICINQTYKKAQYLFAQEGKILFRVSSKNSDGEWADWSKWSAVVNDTDLSKALTKKADTATTLAGYGITDAYTQTEVDALLDENVTNQFSKLKGDIADITSSLLTNGKKYDVVGTTQVGDKNSYGIFTNSELACLRFKPKFKNGDIDYTVNLYRKNEETYYLIETQNISSGDSCTILNVKRDDAINIVSNDYMLFVSGRQENGFTICAKQANNRFVEVIGCICAEFIVLNTINGDLPEKIDTANQELTNLENTIFSNGTQYNITGTSNVSNKKTYGIFTNKNLLALKFKPQFTNEIKYSVDVYRKNDGEYFLFKTIDVQAGEYCTLYDVKFDDAIIIVADEYVKYKSSVDGSGFTCASKTGTNTFTEVKVTVGGIYILLEKSSSQSENTSPLKNKKITVIGDSITEKNPWASTNWAMWLNYWCGCAVQNLGISGTGFINQQPYVNRISKIDIDTDIIGVACSFNDMPHALGSVSDTISDGTILGYVNNFIDTILSTFPTTPIIFYIQNTWAYYRPGIEKSDLYVAGLKQVCKNKGIPFYCDMYENGSVLRPWISSNQSIYFKSEITGNINDVHPNSMGHKIIAQNLKKRFEQNVVWND